LYGEVCEELEELKEDCKGQNGEGGRGKWWKGVGEEFEELEDFQRVVKKEREGVETYIGGERRSVQVFSSQGEEERA
jgi:hypothetical protein